VLDFWFGAPGTPEHGQPRAAWFKKSEAFDAEIRARFLPLYEAALRGARADWARDPRSTLALIVVLDQFPRNLFREGPEAARAYAADPQALALARRLVTSGGDRPLSPVERWFAYLPFEHAEDLAAQGEALRLFTQLKDETGLAEPLPWAQKHYDVIARFGRFPHRNGVLGRASTDAEAEFLKQPGSRF
jgi:uncharacterized protein (DUF924 family)